MYTKNKLIAYTLCLMMMNFTCVSCSGQAQEEEEIIEVEKPDEKPEEPEVPVVVSEVAFYQVQEKEKHGQFSLNSRTNLIKPTEKHLKNIPIIGKIDFLMVGLDQEKQDTPLVNLLLKTE
jgi:kynurenine formamidase